MRDGIEAEEDWAQPDVRGTEERVAASIDGSEHNCVGKLTHRCQDLDKKQHSTLMCASGMRASIAAGWLASRGFEKPDIHLGLMGAWKAAHG